MFLGIILIIFWWFGPKKRPISKVKNLTVIKFDFCISMKTAFQRPKAREYETGGKMSLTHHKKIDKIRHRLDVRSEMPFQFCLSHAVSFPFTIFSNFFDTLQVFLRHQIKIGPSINKVIINSLNVKSGIISLSKNDFFLPYES